MRKILFMCVANSARSQMAEGFAKNILGEAFEVASAGSEPSKVNPFAIQAMEEVGIDIANHHSKSYDQLSPKFLVNLDYIITLCAEEVCPSMASRTAKRLHWPFQDPANKNLSPADQLVLFRKVREQIKEKILEFSSEISDER